MAKVFTWACVLLVAINLASNAQSQDNVLQIEQQLDPVHQVQLGNEALEGDVETRGDREKRLGIIKKIGLKAGLLDFVFGKIDSFIDAKTRAINEIDKQNIIKNQKYFGITYPPKAPQNNLRPATPSTPAPVDFPVNSAVSLVIPDRLYGNSFTLVTNASKILGDVIYNTADRAQELADRVNSRLKNKFYFAKKFLKFKYPVFKTTSDSGSSSSSTSSSGTSINLLTKRDLSDGV